MRATLSASAQYFMLYCLGPGVPTFTLKSVNEGIGKSKCDFFLAIVIISKTILISAPQIRVSN